MCNHDRLRTVGDRVFCCECGEELDLEFLMKNTDKPEEKKPRKAKRSNSNDQKVS